MSAPLPDRPRPLFDALRTVGMAVALAGSVVVSLVGWGVLTAAQGDALSGLLGVIPGLIALVTAFLAAFGVVRKAEPAVTPVADPAVEIDGALIALVPAHGRHEAP